MSRNFSAIKTLALHLAASIIATLSILHPETLAQGTFNAGQKVVASPLSLKDEKYFKECTVIKFESTGNAYLLNCDGAEYLVTSAYIKAIKDDRKTNDEAKNDNKQAHNTDETPKPQGKSGFKVGDRVKASPKMLKDERYYQPCTITSINPPNSYGVRCDPFDNITFTDYSVREDFVRAWAGATPAPVFECSFNQPAVINLKTSPASATTFKRVIYELEAAKQNKTKVGVTFETFQVGSSFRNYVVNRGGVKYDFPPTATIYPIKTRFVRCVEGKDYNYRTVVESGFVCAKNQFGEWSCGVEGGAPKEIDRQSVPKDQ